MDIINNFFAQLSNFLWGNFGVANLVIGGGIFFLVYSRLTPFRYFKHAFEILLGKHDDPDDEGQITHFQALSTALSSTVGIGNIAGVTVACTLVLVGSSQFREGYCVFAQVKDCVIISALLAAIKLAPS